MAGVEQQLQDGVLSLTLQRPDKKNALNQQMYQQLADALKQAAEDDQVKVVLLQGQDDCFTAGNDLQDFIDGGELNQQHPTVRFLYQLAEFPKPIVAAVAGLAIGIGTTALLHCELVYATADTRFQLPFTKLGLCPEAASSLLLPQLIGYHRACEYLLLAEPFDGVAAERMGLVNRLLPHDELLAFAGQKARQLAAMPTQAIQSSKRLLKANQQEALHYTLREELNEFQQLLQSDACQQAVQQFFQKK
ncbi:enoyl-CoA hydratase [Alkalimonas amylolytica]|uniref:Enoyl-CoA hydratase/carnithine racemase n=1 Tax=Alkalimonas amylolytica TaxID=152573 RepID=A0A1H4A5Z2_ALKAM|nr:enoyl-CoA hydratase [Alkalimonas amylolytica]SEA31327.1 Enoyl-CoA hydratase/carnithine racemase [Alkalimonas amylolytica]